MKKIGVLLVLLLIISKVGKGQHYSDEKLAELEEYFVTWTYDSLIVEGTEHLIIASFSRDEGIKEDEANARIEVAIVIFDEAIKRNSDDPNNYSWRGAAKRLQGKYAKALLDFSIASKLEPNNFKNYEAKADCKVKLEDFYGAILDFTKAISKTNESDYSEYHRLYADRGYSYLMQNKNEKALRDYNRAISIKDDISKYYLLRGMAQLGLDEIEKSCLDFSKAGELGNMEAFDIIKDFCND